MKVKKELILSVVCILLGSIFVYYSYLQITAEKSKFEKEVNIDFDTKSIISKPKYLTVNQVNCDENAHTVWAVFLITTKACPPCFTEIDEYINLINKEFKQIRPILIVMDQDLEKAKRFGKLSGINSSIFASNFEDVAKDFKLDVIPNGIFYVSKRNNKIYYREILPQSVVSSLEQKQNSINKILNLHTKL